mgnify:CR=1 FL=1
MVEILQNMGQTQDLQNIQANLQTIINNQNILAQKIDYNTKLLNELLNDKTQK